MHRSLIVVARFATTRALPALIILATAACKDPHNQPIPADLKSIAEDTNFQGSVQKLPPAERELFAGYMMRTQFAKAFTGETGNAKTVGEAITDQKGFLEKQKAKEAEEKALAETVASGRAVAMKAMDDTLTVAVTDKSVLAKDYNAGRLRDQITITVAFHNKSTKDLVGIKGKIVYKDVFGDEVSSSVIKVDDPISAGNTYVWHGGKDINQFISADRKLAETPLDKLKVTWEPNTYLFKDGTSLSAPDRP